MKRILSLILIFMLLLTACGKEAPSTEPSETPGITVLPGESGPEGIQEEDVQTIYVLTKFSSLDENGRTIWYQEYDYNDQGYETARREYLADGSMSFEQRNTLDDRGNILKADCNRSGTLYVYTREYDEHNNLTLETTQENGQFFQRVEYSYDQMGNVSKILLTMPDNFSQTLTFSYTYDDQGNMLTREDHTEGEGSFRTEFTYDDQNRCIKELVYDITGALQGSYETTWEGNVSTRLSYGPDGALFLTEVSTYDDQGNLILRENQYAGGEVSQTEYEYATIEIKK